MYVTLRTKISVIQVNSETAALDKKLCYRRWTARRAMPVKILSTVETSCTTNPQQIEVTEERIIAIRL